MNCTGIKVGDRVVLKYLGNAITAGHLRIDTVAKVTPTQIVLASNPGVGRQGRYRRMDGKPIGGGYLWPWITAVATETQIADYEAEEAAKLKAVRERREQQEAIKAKEDQLARLFTKPFEPYVRTDGEKFSIEFTLTAAQVRKMARLLSK